MLCLKLFRRVSLLAITLGTVVFWSMTVQAATTIKLSYNGAPDADKNAVHLFTSNLKQLVEDKTDGNIQIKLYPNSMLGSEPQRMEQVMNMPMLNVASFAGMAPVLPEIFVTAIPFLFQDFEAARNFFDKGDFWKEAKKEFYKRTGARILAVIEEGGFLAFTNSVRPIHEPSDFKGLKFRAMDKSQVALFEAFDASGTPIPWTETYMALRTGVADGQMNPPMYIILGSLYEVQKYLTRAHIQYSDQFLIANDALLESLTDSQRQALRESVNKAVAITRDAVQAKVEERYAFLAEHGMEIYKPTPEQMARFREIGQPAYMEWLQTQDIGPRWIETALTDVGATELAAEYGTPE